MEIALGTQMTDFVAGVDGGGSKTRVILADMRGDTLADVVGPGFAMRPGGGDHSAEVIGDVVRRAMAEAGMESERPRVLLAGVAGVGRAAENRALTVALDDLEIADEVVVQGDGEIALTDAFGPGPGVILISGTGSIVASHVSWPRTTPSSACGRTTRSCGQPSGL